MVKPKITIYRGTSSCEDCGGYEWGTVSIERNGVEVARHGWDGHLGGDIQGPDYDLEEFLKVILTALGVDADIEETELDD